MLKRFHRKPNRYDGALDYFDCNDETELESYIKEQKPLKFWSGDLQKIETIRLEASELESSGVSIPKKRKICLAKKLSTSESIGLSSLKLNSSCNSQSSQSLTPEATLNQTGTQNQSTEADPTQNQSTTSESNANQSTAVEPTTNQPDQTEALTKAHLTSLKTEEIDLAVVEIAKRFHRNALDAVERSLKSNSLKPAVPAKLTSFQTGVTVEKKHQKIVGLVLCPFCNQEKRINYQGSSSSGKGWNYGNFINHLNKHENDELPKIDLQ